jgi:hypothetical protein
MQTMTTNIRQEITIKATEVNSTMRWCMAGSDILSREVVEVAGSETTEAWQVMGCVMV